MNGQLRILLPVLCVLTAAVICRAAPYVGYLYPSGAQAGKSVRLLIGGQDLGGIRTGIVTGDGVTVRKVTQVPNFPPPDGGQRRYLLEWIRNIESGNPNKPKLPEGTDSWRKNEWWEKLDRLDPFSFNLVIRDLHTRRNALQATPSIRQMLIVDLDVALGAEPGIREFRLWGNRGVSAPKLFFIDAAPHTAEPGFTAPDKPRPEAPRAESLPAVFDGRIMPGETDRFRLELEKGRPYSMTLTGRKFQPFIGDAVPGHFQPVLRLLGPDGREAAFADDDYFNPDPVLRFTAPESGEYTLEVRDNLYRGREDFVYRVAVDPVRHPYRFGPEPFPGLPRLDAGNAADRPLTTDRQQVIEGSLGNSERALFRIRGKKGDDVTFELAARRFNSPLDGVFRLTGPDGKVIAEADDTPQKFNIGECLQQCDPSLRLTLPADGEYLLELSDRTGAGGDDCRYRLRIGPPRPDFEVYTSKSALNLAPGATGRIKLYIVRNDGFDGEIVLTAQGAPLTGKTTIPAGTGEFMLGIRNPAGGMTRPESIRFYAEAVINGKRIRKPVIPCDEFIQAFAYTHLLPCGDFQLGTLQRQRKK